MELTVSVMSSSRLVERNEILGATLELRPHPTLYNENPLRGLMAEEVGLISAFGLHPCGAALRAVFAAVRRSNCVLIPPSTMIIRYAD